jgi:hypothetical protein
VAACPCGRGTRISHLLCTFGRAKGRPEAALAEAVGAPTRGRAESRSTIKLDEHLDEWFAAALQSLRPTTARGYAQAIGRLSKVLGVCGRLAELERDDPLPIHIDAGRKLGLCRRTLTS